MSINVRDSDNVLRQVRAITVRDSSNILRTVQMITVRGPDNVLRQVYAAGNGGAAPGGTGGLSTDYVYGAASSRAYVRVTTSYVAATAPAGSTYQWRLTGGRAPAGTNGWAPVAPTGAETNFRSPPINPEGEDSDTFEVLVTPPGGAPYVLGPVTAVAQNNYTLSNNGGGQPQQQQ